MTNITRPSCTAWSTTAARLPTRARGTRTCTPFVRRSRGARRAGREHTMALNVSEAGEQVVGPQPGGELQQADRRAGVHGEDELLGLHEVRGEPPQAATLANPFENEPHLAVLEIAESAVDELRGATRRPRGEVRVLDERRREAPHGGVARDARAVDAAADHEEVERLGAEAAERRAARDHAPILPTDEFDVTARQRERSASSRSVTCAVVAVPPRSRVRVRRSASRRRAARSRRPAAAGWPTWRSSMTPEKIAASGLATPFPAMSGAVPCTASKIATRLPMLAPGTSPSPPTRPAHRSDTMSP